ncbi:hypothetical protein D3C74_395890 [compost metagenome]
MLNFFVHLDLGHTVDAGQAVQEKMGFDLLLHIVQLNALFLQLLLIDRNFEGFDLLHQLLELVVCLLQLDDFTAFEAGRLAVLVHVRQILREVLDRTQHSFIEE